MAVGLLVLLGSVLLAPCAALAEDPLPAPPLGIGFLWYPRSEAAAAKLTADWDFVDLILGRDKLGVFDRIQRPVRVSCLALCLEGTDARPFPGMRQTIELLRAASVDPERVILAYNPERAPGTPPEEMDNLLESVRRAREMAEAFGSPLLVGPGYREMSQQEELYPELARNCDLWLIQSQRLQLEPLTRRKIPPEEYRAGVQRIVEKLRQGKPELPVVVQILASGRRDEALFTAEEVVAYARSIEDLVQAVRIYGGSEQLLEEVIRQLRPSSDQPETAEE